MTESQELFEIAKTLEKTEFLLSIRIVKVAKRVKLMEECLDHIVKEAQSEQQNIIESESVVDLRHWKANRR